MNNYPYNQSVKFGEYGHDVIHRKLKTIVKKNKSVFKNNNTEALHEMRVAIRGLGSAIHIFSAGLNLPKKVTEASINKISRRIGKPRDMDVLQEILINQYQPLLLKNEQPAFNMILKSVQRTRLQDYKKLKKSLNGKRYQEMIKSIREWVNKPSYTIKGQLPLAEVLPELLWQSASELFVHPGWQTDPSIDGNKNDLDALHDLRKEIKRARYQAEFFIDFYDDSYREKIEDLKTAQEMLGQLHDRIILRTHLEITLKIELAKVLPSVDKKLREDNEMFWGNWRAIQLRYLSPEFQNSLKTLLYAHSNFAFH